MSDPTSPAVQTGGQAHAARGVPVPVYDHLSTDFYPWDEVIADLKARAQAGQSLLFQACADTAAPSGASALFVWRAGQLLGGYSGPRDLNFAALMRGLPRARVSLLPLSDEAASAIWAHRTAPGQPLQGTAEGVAGQLAGQTGVLSSVDAAPRNCTVSYWEGGEPRWGSWTPDAPAQTWQFVALRRVPDTAELMHFWRQVLAVTHRRAALDEVWRQVALVLAPQHPVLDPFTRELTVQTGELQLDSGAQAEELQPALLAAYRAVLDRLGLRLSDLPLNTLRQHELWSVSGLPTLEGERP